MASILYGYTRSISGIIPDIERARVVEMIYDAYLSGLSLAGVIDRVHEKEIPSPSGKGRWSIAVLHAMLTDSRYIPLIGFEKYVAAQFELDHRSKIDQDTGKRKSTRYHSKNVLSGLFVCAECGRSYRRVQRASGEIVWRCANRVEHGSRICKASPTITEEEVVRYVCDILNIGEIEPDTVRQSLEFITVNQDKTLTPEFKSVALSMEVW